MHTFISTLNSKHCINNSVHIHFKKLTKHTNKHEDYNKKNHSLNHFVFYDSETLSLHRLRVFENKVRSKIFGPKMKKVTAHLR